MTAIPQSTGIDRCARTPIAVTQWRKELDRILTLASARSIRFDDLCSVLLRLGFKDRRQSGSHRIFSHAAIPEIINLQPRRDGLAKPYQVRQVRHLILRYKLYLGVE